MLLPFLKPGYCKLKRENKSQAKAQECFYLDPAPNHPRDAVRVLTKHRALLITGHVTWQRVSPSPPVPAQMHNSLPQEEGSSEADDESTSDGGGGGVMDEQDEGLARLTDLDVTWGFDMHAFLRERSQETPAAGDAGDLNACLQERSPEAPVAGDAGDGTAETMDSSQGGAVDASSVPTGRAETVETMDSSQGGAIDAFSVPAGRAETAETMDSSQGGEVDASSVPAGRAESGSDASAASGTDQGNGEGLPAVLSGRAAHELSSWGRLPPTVMGRTRGQNQRLQDESVQRQRVIEDAMSAAVQKWTEFGGMLANTSWTTEDAMAMMARGLAAEENKGETNVCMPSGFRGDVEPPSQSVADVARSQYKAAWRKAMKTELDDHKTTGTYEAATPPRERKPVGAKRVLSYKTDKDGIIAKTKARLVARGFSQVQDVDYF